MIIKAVLGIPLFTQSFAENVSFKTENPILCCYMVLISVRDCPDP